LVGGVEWDVVETAPSEARLCAFLMKHERTKPSHTNLVG